jgi:hypothetical protein
VLAVAATAAPARAYDLAGGYAEVVNVRSTTMTENPPASIGSARATLVLEDVAAGEVHHLFARSVSDRGYPDRNALAQKITCEKPDGTIVQESWTGTNLLAARGPHTLEQRLLFVAPEAGTYYCRQRVYTDSHFVTPARARLVSGFIADISGAIPAAKVIHARERFGSIDYFTATDTSVHRVLPVVRYAPPAGLRRLVVRNDIFVTNCYGGGGAGCPRGTFPATGSTTLTLQAKLVPSNPACPTFSSARVTRTFSSYVHHQGEMLDVSGRIPPNCGSWSSHVEVRRVSGLPFVVQFYPYSQSFIYST